MASVGSVVPPPGLEEMVAPPAVRPQACKGKVRGPTAPPGLEAAWAPARAPAPPQAAAAPLGSLAELPAQSQSGLWMSAVHAASPYLTSEGLNRALAIVDRAIWNASHAKALDEIVRTIDPSEWDAPEYIQAAAYARAQISTEQMHLLGELQKLSMYYTEPEVVAAPVPTGRASPAATAAAVPAPAAALAAAPVAAPAAEPAPAQTPTRAAKTSKTSLRHVQTLSASLQLISQENADCLFVVRHINKLGFRALQTLKRHYSEYGTVVRVYGSHSTVRQYTGPDCRAKRRPCSLGFVQMAEPEAVRAILALGPEQEVEGALIRLTKFERRQAEASQDEEQINEPVYWEFERYTSSGSDKSTATASTCVPEDLPASKGSSVDVLPEAEEYE